VVILSSKEIFISGYAKFPKGITATELYSVVALGLLVNRDTGQILDAEASLVTTVAQNLFRKNIIGKNINQIEEIEKIFKETYFGSAKKAILSALRTCHEKYKQIKEGLLEENE
jgi:uncharacterized protein DUF3870